MRHFSVILLVLCMLLPPALVPGDGRRARAAGRRISFTRAIEDVSTGDPQPLLEGSVRLRDVLRTNIDAFLRASALRALRGVGPGQASRPGAGPCSIPTPYDEDPGVPAPANPTAVARENFAFLSEGLVVQVDVILEHNRLLSNAILGRLRGGGPAGARCSTIEPPTGTIGREETERRRESRPAPAAAAQRTPIDSPSCRATAKPWCRSFGAPAVLTARRTLHGPSATRTTSSRKSNRSKSGSRRTCDLRTSSSRRSRPSRKT